MITILGVISAQLFHVPSHDRSILLQIFALLPSRPILPMSDRKENTAIQENLTSENSQASAELSLTDNRLDTGRLESKIEIHENPIKDEEPQRKQSLSTPVFGFTQYAADSPYPAASLNFASVLNNLVSP